jgi:hypothetical protein
MAVTKLTPRAESCKRPSAGEPAPVESDLALARSLTEYLIFLDGGSSSKRFILRVYT